MVERNKVTREALRGEGERILDLIFETRWPYEVTQWLAAPLESATAWGKSCLSSPGGEISAASQRGHTALHVAAYYGWDAVHSLVEAGADLEAGDKGGRKPLHYAAGGGFVPTICP
eukprot:g11777.t1